MTCAHIREQATPEKYLRGELSANESEQYELHYFSCDECFQDLEALRLTGVTLASRPREPLPAAASGGGRRWFWWWAMPAAAAACAVLMFAVWQSRQPKLRIEHAGRIQTGPAPIAIPVREAKLIALARFEPPTYKEALLRGAGRTASAEFASAMRSYQAEDYGSALAILNRLLVAKGGGKVAANAFYAGACRMTLHGFGGAGQAATQTIALGETPYLEESYWLRAKSRFALGRIDLAREDLRQLAALKGDWENKARELLAQAEGVR